MLRMADKRHAEYAGMSQNPDLPFGGLGVADLLGQD